MGKFVLYEVSGRDNVTRLLPNNHSPTLPTNINANVEQFTIFSIFRIAFFGIRHCNVSNSLLFFQD